MNLNGLLALLPFIYWGYLIDPFKRRPLRRNYLRLYKDLIFLWTNVIISLILLLLRTPFSSMPLFFIIVALLINKLSILTLKRNFLFIQRWDLVKGKFIDHLFSFILLFLPGILSIIAMFIF